MKAGWVTIDGLKDLSLDDVDLYNLYLDALEEASLPE